MIVHGIDRNSDQLDTALVELMFHLGHGAELRGAYWCEVLGMREEHHPGALDIIVEPDPAFGGVGLEIGCGVAELQGHDGLLAKMFTL